ncbi:MAG: hypothetical protein ACRD3Q_08055 [Terriglobales bacterium]
MDAASVLVFRWSRPFLKFQGIEHMTDLTTEQRAAERARARIIATALAVVAVAEHFDSGFHHDSEEAKLLENRQADATRSLGFLIVSDIFEREGTDVFTRDYDGKAREHKNRLYRRDEVNAGRYVYRDAAVLDGTIVPASKPKTAAPKKKAARLKLRKVVR